LLTVFPFFIDLLFPSNLYYSMIKKYYHVFGNGWDEFYNNFTDAQKHFNEAKKQGQEDLRIYELFDGSDNTEDGDCLLSLGAWPA